MSQQIASFVFFDIETTGLPWQERNQTKIIELSFVAAMREDIRATAFGDTPPLSKLTFLVHPQRQIHHDVTRLTGLSNDLLTNSSIFQQKINTVTSFLQDLPKPICLVAHNGNTFDFKILLAEFNDASASLPEDILCVDSLIGFRKLLKGTSISHANLSIQIPTSSNDDLLTDDEDNWPDLNVSTEEWQQIDDVCLSLSDISCEDCMEAEQSEQRTKVKKTRSKAIKKLFDKKPVTKDEKETFTLSALYKRLLNKEEVNAHRAEVDCLMLIQCVVAMKDEFITWADGACKLLTDIKPLARY